MAEQLTLDGLREQYLASLTPAERSAHEKGKAVRPFRHRGGYPLAPGSGPAGETCGSCANFCRTSVRSDRTFFKCWVINDCWTHGAGTDIRKKSPACALWQPAPEGPGVDPKRVRVGKVTRREEREWRGRGQSREQVVVAVHVEQLVVWRCPGCGGARAWNIATEEVAALLERISVDGRCEWCKTK